MRENSKSEFWMKNDISELDYGGNACKIERWWLLCTLCVRRGAYSMIFVICWKICKICVVWNSKGVKKWKTENEVNLKKMWILTVIKLVSCWSKSFENYKFKSLNKVPARADYFTRVWIWVLKRVYELWN